MAARPLEGFVVGITADRRWSEQADLLRRRGAEIIHGPSIATAFLARDQALHDVTLELVARPPDYLTATTGLGIRAWMEAARGWGLAESLIEALGRTRIVARGPKSASAVQAAGLTVWRSAANEQMNEVIAILAGESLAGRRVAVQRYGMPAPELMDALGRGGAEVVEVVVYQWRTPDDPGPCLELIGAAIEGRLHAVTFTAAPAATNLFAIAASAGLDHQLLEAFNQRGVVAACVGPVCALGATGAGIESPLVPPVGRLGLLIRFLSDRLQPPIAASGPEGV
jgi:uroporphyrinogen-III synthase